MLTPQPTSIAEVLQAVREIDPSAKIDFIFHDEITISCDAAKREEVARLIIERLSKRGEQC